MQGFQDLFQVEERSPSVVSVSWWWHGIVFMDLIVHI